MIETFYHIMTFKLSALVYWTLGLINGNVNSCLLVALFLHTFACSPDESPRTETSYFLLKSLELKCHLHLQQYIYKHIYIHIKQDKNSMMSWSTRYH